MSNTIHESREGISKHLNEIFNEIVKVLRSDRMVGHLSNALNNLKTKGLARTN